MTEGHIYIYGIISPENKSLQSVLAQLQNASDADILKVHIRSEGGDVIEGRAIYKALMDTKKPIDTIGEGIVASIATIPYLAGKNRSITPNPDFVIHNPWGSGKGTASDFEKNAALLRDVENELLQFYTANTKAEPDIIKNFMNNEIKLTTDQLIEYGFATEVVSGFKAVALFNNSNILTMTKEELDLAVENKFTSFFDKFKNLFSSPKNLKVTAGDGTVLDFGEQVQEQKEIAVGMTATMEGGTPAGDYVMPDGSKLTFEAGKVTAITPVVEAKSAALEAENTELKAQIENLKAQNLLAQENLTKATGSISEMKAEFTALKAQIKTDVESFTRGINVNPDEPVARKLNKSLI